ncbi:MAG: putative signal transducing protein [Rhizobiaceae bacterium]
MIELIRTNDPVLISYVEALMRDAGIACFVADQNMSIIEGSLGILPKRVMVDGNAVERARRILFDAGVGHEMKKK